MRDALSKGLVAAADADPRIMVLTGDHGYALFDDFRRHHPDKFLNCGVAEQNMVGMAAGLARAGFRPIVYGLSAFVPVRVLEQIKLDIAHDDLPVLLLGDGAGFVARRYHHRHIRGCVRHRRAEFRPGQPEPPMPQQQIGPGEQRQQHKSGQITR